MEEPHQRSRWAAAKRADPPSTYPTLTGQPAPSNKQPLTVQGRQLLAGTGDVTLHGEHLLGPAADVRLG